MAEVFTISGARGLGASVSVPRAAPVRLQNALKALGNVHGDPTISKIAVDGVIGKGTTAAVNRAIAEKYVVMASFPRPELTIQHVRQFASGIAAAVESAVKAAGGTFPLVPTNVGAKKKATAAEVAAAQAAAAEPPLAPSHSNTVWWIIGGAGLVLALGFMASAARRRREARV